MTRLQWLAVSAIVFTAASPAFAAPADKPAAGGDSAFSGTWKIDAGQTKFSPKPQTFYVSEGWYHCDSCSPQFAVKADGTDQSVTGQSYDTLAVKAADDNTLQIVGKKDGKVMFEQTRTVSKDGKTLTVKTVSHPMDGSAPINTESTGKRMGALPAGVHAVSGQWQILKFSQSDNGLTFTYKVNGDEITMTAPNGESYTAKFDGTDAPVKGAYGYDTVSIKKTGPGSFEETDKRGGNVVEVAKITVHGKTMTIEDTSKPSDRTSTYTAHKVD